MRSSGVRAPLLYLVPGVVIWAGFLATGIHPTIGGVVLGPCVWRREHVCEWREKWYRVQERYFLVHVGAPDVRPAALDPGEADFLVAHRWWPAAEIAASGATFVPRRLGLLLPPLLRGEIPEAPLDVGV